MNELDLTFVEQITGRVGTGKEKMLELLQAIQHHYGFLPQKALQRLCEITAITPAEVTGVATFYNQFRHRPVGRHIIRVCVGTACHVKGATEVYEAFRRYLNIADGEDTDPQKNFTIEKIACLGCCTLAPAAQIDGITYGHLGPEKVASVLDDFRQYRQDQIISQRSKRTVPAQPQQVCGEIRLGLGSCCIARGSGKVYEATKRVLQQAGINAKVKRVGCVGMCHQTPLLEVVLPDKRSFLYARIEPEDVKAIILRHFKVRSITRRVSGRASAALERLLTGRDTPPITRYEIDVREKALADFLGKQKHIATEHYGRVDPVDIDEYILNDGFKALTTCLKQLTAEQIINEIRHSGLRGRGGAGFPTHLKWSAVHNHKADQKYIVCNGDEGDPGAFMDRMIMESYPYRIIEGITIAARAVGADKGYFYIRAEYPLAIDRMSKALEESRRRGLLGQNILDSGFSFDLQIVAGAGAFVCGEETALMASIEGRRGMPRLRPPYPAEKGLWDKPTLINNVETFATVPWIIRNGGEALARLGFGNSKGTKVFALAGKIARGGLIEVPMGITIREIVEDIGGGIAGGKKLKAVQIGGPSGGCVPAELIDMPVDYETLLQAGTMMGSGGMVVLDESDCMVEIARYFLEFTQNQSCGRCTFCRIGTRRMLETLDRLCSGKGRDIDIEQLDQLAKTVRQASLCGLGKTAPNPVLSTLRYFRQEYEAHIAGRCPAGRCRALVTYSITDDCIGCTLCAQQCPADAIEFKPYQKHEIDTDKCIRCGSCKSICPVEAVKVE